MSNDENTTQNEEQFESQMENLGPTSNEAELKEMMKNLDREQAYREHTCWRQYITVLVSIAFVVFQLYSSLSGMVTAQILRATHLAFVQMLAFLLFPATKKLPRNHLPWYDVVLALVGAACWFYIVVNFQELARRTGAFTFLDIFVACVGILVLAESCRRIVGLPILIIATCFVLYALFGRYMPGFLNHRGYSIKRVAAHLFYNT